MNAEKYLQKKGIIKTPTDIFTRCNKVLHSCVSSEHLRYAIKYVRLAATNTNLTNDEYITLRRNETKVLMSICATVNITLTWRS